MKRCKTELSSNPLDKVPRWVVTENSPTPTLIRNKEEESSPSRSATDSTKSIPSAESPPSSSGTAAGKKKRRGKKVTQPKKTEITLTAYEQEMIEWACNGFLPCGPEGLWPSSDDQEQIDVVPFGDDYERELPESNANPDANPDVDYQPKRKSKVMLVPMKKRGEIETD